MPDSRVLLSGDRKDGPDEGIPPSHRVAWSLLGWVGLVFAIVGGVDLALAWYPWQLGDPEWEFGTISATLDRLPLVTMGAAFVLVSGVAGGTVWLVRGVGIGLFLAAAAIGLAALVYATDVPLALQSASTPLIKLGLQRAIIKAAAQGLLYPITFVALAISSWRHTSRR